MMLAIKSIAEWVASEMTEMDPIKTPAIILKTIRHAFEEIERNAAFCLFMAFFPVKRRQLIK
jgi:hypothetical protein